MNRKRLIFQILAVSFLLAVLNVLRVVLSKNSLRPVYTDELLLPPQQQQQNADSKRAPPVINSVPPLFEDVLEDPTGVLNKYDDSLAGFHDGMASATLPLMLANLLVLDGPVLAMGLHSVTTRLLDRLAHDYNRSVESMDVAKRHDFDYTLYNRTRNHRVRLVENGELATYGQTDKWAFVFVDHGQASMRASNVIQFHLNAQIVLAHDAERANEVAFLYEQKLVKSYFKYACKYTVFRRESGRKRQRYYSTLVLSDYVNLKVMKKILSDYKPDDYEKLVCEEPS